MQPGAKRGDYPTVSSIGAASPWIPHAVLGPTIQEGCEGPPMCPEENNKDGERAGRNILWGVAEDFGAKEAEGSPRHSLQLWEEGGWSGRCWSLLLGIQWQNVSEWFKAAPGRVKTGHEEPLLRGSSNAAAVFLERWSVPQACQCWRGIWTMPLMTYLSFWSVLDCSVLDWSVLDWSGSGTGWLLSVPSSCNSLLHPVSALSIKCYCSFRQCYFALVFWLYFYVILMGGLEMVTVVSALLEILYFWSTSSVPAFWNSLW